MAGYNPNEPRNARGEWASMDDYGYAIHKAASDKKKGKLLTISELEKIKPQDFYKLEYFSKTTNEWKPMLNTDSPVRLKKSGYDIRYKELYQYIL